MTDDYVTVLICCYNEGELLQRAFDSVKNQTYQKTNVIVINDCSKDINTNRICHKLENDEHTLVIWQKKNTGLSGARNCGINLATTEIIIPLDADDTLPENAIETIVNAFKEQPQADFIFGNYTKIDEQNNQELVDCSYFTNQNQSINPTNLAKTWRLLGTSPLKKKTWVITGGYDLRFTNTVQDVDFWMRVLLSDLKGFYINANIYNWYIRSVGMNCNVPSIHHYHNFKKNIKFYLRFGLIPTIKDCNNIIFLNYYSNRFYWNALKFGTLHYFNLPRYSKKRVILIPLFLISPKLISYFKKFIDNLQ